jgi:hypothetical protein
MATPINETPPEQNAKFDSDAQSGLVPTTSAMILYEF